MTTRGGQSSVDNMDNVGNVGNVGRSGPHDVKPQRLIGPENSTASSELDRWAVDILAAGTLRESIPGQKQRVWLLLAHSTERRSGFLIRRLTLATAAAAVVVVCGTALASAALGHWPDWARGALHGLVGGSADKAETPSRSPVAGRHAGRLAGGVPGGGARSPQPADPALAQAALPTVEPIAVAPPAVPELVAATGASDGVASDPAASSSRPGSRSGEIGRRDSGSARGVRRPRSPGVAVPSGTEDAGPVLAAVRALRREHDPVKARALLGGYLSTHPNGALAQEALAISIEAAVANRDADAGTLATRYLRLYPNGPFHGLAERALLRSGSR